MLVEKGIRSRFVFILKIIESMSSAFTYLNGKVRQSETFWTGYVLELC